MASLLQQHPLLLSPSQSYAPPFHPRTLLRIRKPMSPHFHRGGGVTARLGPVGFSEFHAAGELAKELFQRAEGYAYTLADAAVTSTTSPELAGAVVEEGQKQGRDWLSGITDYMESVLKVLKDGLSAVHVPYSYGFAIILLTVLVKAATFPLTKKQVESAMAMRSLQPEVKAIQERYAGNQEKIQLETARLYKVAGVNPLAGCLPTLATIPVWIGLYRALSNVANEGLLTEGFFWIPSLAGPTTIAARQSGSGVSWLFPFVDGHPPLGWPDTLAYLVLPVLLVVSQYISTQVMQPATQGNDPSQKNAQAITKFLPLMIGYFALSVPSGMSLYWFTNNILSTAQQIWLQKLGGAKNPFKENDAGSKETLSSISTGTEEIMSNIKTDLKSDIIKEISSQPKLESGGPQPGERFRQIKEQEERRREREAEQRKAEEAAKASQTNVGDQKILKPRNLNFVEGKMQMEEFSVDEKSKSTVMTDDSSKIDSTNINGSHANQDPNDVKTNLQFSSNGGNAHKSDAEVDDSRENAF